MRYYAKSMKFAAIIEYTRDAEKIAAIRPLHRTYLKGLLDTGRIVISGPFTDDSGGLLVYETASQQEAEDLIRNDPFAQNGVFVSWKIQGWRVVMSNPELCKI